MCAAEIQVFWPLRTKPPFWRSARQERLPTSEPGLGLGHRDRLDPARGDPAEDLLLLLLGAEALVGAGDDQADAVAGDRHEAAHRLLEEDAGVDEAAARAAVLLVDRDAEPAELGELLVDLLAVQLGVALGEALALLLGAELALAEVGDRGLEVALLVGQARDGASVVLMGSVQLLVVRREFDWK